MMFCKYCGGNLVSGDMKCKRCGREVAAKSDCGGFYDLVQEEKSAQPTIVMSAPKAKMPVGLITAFTAGFVVLLALVIVLFAGQSKQAQELEDLRNEIEDLSAVCETEAVTLDDGETEGSEELNITIPDLFGKDEEVPDNTTAPEV